MKMKYIVWNGIDWNWLVLAFNWNIAMVVESYARFTCYLYFDIWQYYELGIELNKDKIDTIYYYSILFNKIHKALNH